jgi:hypothetical protein
MMAVIFYFDVQGMSSEKYDEVINRLEAAGAGSPKGRSYHVAFGSPGELKVVDVWDSQQDFDAFGETLVPILTELGIDPRPRSYEVRNVIVG